MLSIEDAMHLRIPLMEVSLATDGFDNKNLVGNGGFGKVYKGVSKTHGQIAIKRLDDRYCQGDHEFKTEIALLSKCKHKNIVSLLGFVDEAGEKILVYKYESNASLDKHISNENLSWIQRLQICLDVARGLNYLHYGVGFCEQILHRDVKSSNILLDENWNPKISDFGLASVSPTNMKSTNRREGPANPETSYIISSACGTVGYIDPDYRNNGYLTQKSDVYSFGVVLFEVLCGRLAFATWYNDDRRFLNVLVEKHYKRGTLDNIIPHYLRKQMNVDSLHSFASIAYQCLRNREERPTMKEVVERLQEALNHQLEVNKTGAGKKGDEGVAKPSTEGNKHGVDLENTPPPAPRQEIVLSTYMHCEECARDVKQCLKGFEGVESVLTNCETHRVIVKGEKADPLKVLKRLEKKMGKKVELILPLEYILPTDKKDEFEVEKPEEEAKPDTKRLCSKSPEIYSKDPSQEYSVSLYSMDCFCKGCVQKVRKYIRRFERVKSVAMDQDNSQIMVKGTFSAAELEEYVYKKTRKRIEIVKPG